MTNPPVPVTPIVPVVPVTPVLTQPVPNAAPSPAPAVAQPVVPQSGEGPAAQPVPVHATAPVQQVGTAPAVTPESQAQAQPPVPEPSNEQLVEMYVKLRDAKEAIQQQHKDELKDTNDAMDQIAKILDKRLSESGTKTFSTEHGSATRVITTNAVCNDWDAFHKWVAEHGRQDMYYRKLNYTPFKEMLADEQPLPPGIRMESTSRLNVRRKS